MSRSLSLSLSVPLSFTYIANHTANVYSNFKCNVLTCYFWHLLKWSSKVTWNNIERISLWMFLKGVSTNFRPFCVNFFSAFRWNRFLVYFSFLMNSNLNFGADFEMRKKKRWNRTLWNIFKVNYTTQQFQFWNQFFSEAHFFPIQSLVLISFLLRCAC